MAEKKVNFKLKWDTPKNMKKSLATIANAVANGKIGHLQGTAISTIASVMVKVDKQLITEREVEELKELVEQLIEEKNNSLDE